MGTALFILKMPHTNNANRVGGRGQGRTQVKLELGGGRTESREENIFKKKGLRRGKSMLFILKKKKKKKNVSNKKHSS